MNYWDDEERRKYHPSNWQNLSTRELVGGMLDGKMPIKRNSYDVGKGKSPYYYMDKDMNETDHPIWDSNQPTNTASQNNLYGNNNYGTFGNAANNYINNSNASTSLSNNQPAAPTNQPQTQASTFDNALRKSEQLASAALNGLSLGFVDEIEGALDGLGYGVANAGMRGLNKLGFNVAAPQESTWEAMQRGYQEGRDYRRASLNKGREDMPLTSAAIETISSLPTNPLGKLFSVAKKAPLAMRAAGRMYNNLANGVAYGIGDTEQNSLNEYGKNIGLNAIGAAAGTYTGNKLFGRGYTEPLKREATSATVEKGINALYNGASPYFNKDEEEQRWWRRYF